jgi:hypothetical protein
MSLVYKIDGVLANYKYRGAGHAIAAVTGDRVIDLLYLRDVIHDLDEECEAKVLRALSDKRFVQRVRLMTAYGEVFIGMCERYEFRVL